METKIINSSLVNENCVAATLDNGLKIYVCEMENAKSNYAIFGTHYGSIDTEFGLEGEPLTKVPEGIAHFLEHKLFESEDGDAFSKYAATGAEANAYTSFDRTCYLFSCSDKFYENLEILLGFVSSPYFTEQTVNKEQGIIGQEIRMYLDVPEWRVLFNVLSCLYHNHPVKIDIAGTCESISHITDKLLYTCYNTFYNPSNMFLCVCGKVDAKKVIEMASRLITRENAGEIIRSNHNEPDSIVTDYIEKKMSVAMPLFTLGIKLKPQSKTPSVKTVLCAEILQSVLIGRISDLFYKLLEKGYINDNFSTEFFYGFNYASLLFQGESENPKEVKESILAKIEKIKAEGVSVELFEISKKSLYSSFVRDFNDPEDTVSMLVDSAIDGYEPFEKLNVLSKLTMDDLNEFIEQIDVKNSALSVILPNE